MRASPSTTATLAAGGIRRSDPCPVAQNRGATNRKRRGTHVDLAQGKVTAIASGNFSSCAILQDGSMRCWGANSEGQPG
jgi:hypothetical protein